MLLDHARKHRVTLGKGLDMVADAALGADHQATVAA
jgi:hypothetical protein